MFDYKYHNAELSDFSFLITGGAGFIGSNLAEYLLKYSAKKVRVLDNFSTGSQNNISEFRNHSSFELIEGDIRDLDICKKSLKEIDFVLHHAALGSVPRSLADPISTNEVNIKGFLNMLVASRDANVKRFVYASSSSTYGDINELPNIENKTGKTLSIYAVSKLVNELYAEIFSKTFGLESIGLRYFNVFGPKQNTNGAYAAVIPKFINQLIKHESPTIYGNGENSRDFTFIENVIQANILAVFVKDKDAINNIYNIAYGERTTLNQLFDYLKEFLQEFDKGINNIKPLYAPERKGDMAHSLASIDKAKVLLGYHPKYVMKDGLKVSVKWYLNNLN